jgi:hypothetical protein
MRIARRVAFAAPLVLIVAGCQRPAAQRPDPEDEDEDEDDEQAPIVERPVDAAVPDAWRAPDELVAELKPLTSDRTIEDVCRHARCNPPPPYARSKPDPVETTTVRVTKMRREGTGTRVRLRRAGQPMDPSWRAVFITQAGEEVPGGDCTIVAWDFSELECTTGLPPEQLTWRGEPLQTRLIPPKALVDRVNRERASWVDPTTGGKARVIGMSVVAGGTKLVVARGRAGGVEKDWTVTVIDANDRPIDGGLCTIVSINERATTCTTAVGPDQIKASPQVLLRPGRRQ